MSTRVLKAIGLFGGVKMVEILCGVIRNKVLAVIVGPAGVGLLAIFNRALELVATSTQLNLRQSSVRELSDASSSQAPTVAAAVKWWALRLGILGALIMLALSPLFSRLNFGSLSMWWAFALVALAAFAQSVINGEQALMQGSGHISRLAKATMWGAVGGTLICVPLYYFFGLNGIVPSILAAYAMAFIATWWWQDVKAVPKLLRAENLRIGKEFIRLGVYLTIATFAATGAAYAFITWINHTESQATVGIYQAGYTLIINYAGMVFTAISMEYFPRMVKVSTRPRMASIVVSNEISTLLLVLIPVITIFIAADEPMVRLLYSSEFLAVMPMITIGICGTIFRATSYCMAYVIIARGNGRLYVITEVVSSAIGLLLNILMYGKWGFAGLGVSYVAWFMIYTLIVYLPYRFKYGMRITPTTVVLLVAAMLVSTGAVILKVACGWWAVVPLAVVATVLCGYALLLKTKSPLHKKC